jgi:hypothetical protein
MIFVKIRVPQARIKRSSRKNDPLIGGICFFGKARIATQSIFQTTYLAYDRDLQDKYICRLYPMFYCLT